MARSRTDFAVRDWQNWAATILDWLYGWACALSYIALLAALYSFSGRRNCGLACIERVSRLVSGNLGLALLETFFKIPFACRKFGEQGNVLYFRREISENHMDTTRHLGRHLRGHLGRARNDNGAPVQRISVELSRHHTI